MGYIESLGFGRNSRNDTTLGELVEGFFRFLGQGFRFQDSVVSIREGTELSKEEKNWTKKHTTRTDRFYLCIEDPFEVTHNLGRVADYNRCATIAACLLTVPTVVCLSRG